MIVLKKKFIAYGPRLRRDSAREFNKLTGSERDADHNRTLLACETLIGICEKSLLTAEEKTTVAKIDKHQNLLNCETGNDPCDRTSCERSLLNAGKGKQNNGKPSS